MDTDYANRNDAALVSLVINGDREALDPLVLRYYLSVLRLCVRFLGSSYKAEDENAVRMECAALYIKEKKAR